MGEELYSIGKVEEICKITKKLAIPKIIKSQHRNKPIQQSRIPTNIIYLRTTSTFYCVSVT